MKTPRPGRFLIVGIGLALLQANTARAQQEDLNALNREVSVLQTLYDLELTPVQLKELARLAKGASGSKPAARDIKVSDKLRKALKDLREALLKGDDDRINTSRDQYDELVDAENPDFDETVSLTDGARQRAGQLLEILTVRQLGNVLSNQDVAGPREVLVDGFEDIRGLSEDDKNDQRDTIAEQVGWLVAGLDAARAKQVAGQVAKLLDQVHALKDPDYKKQRPELEKKALALLGKVGNLTVLRNILEHRLAELLSNPFLEAAVQARLKK